ncbi:MAG: dTMP kinase [Candidatus Aenigmarchaeota archaeon]|nr:dTMP kinase [Candidatus Aenigmarchaeota archaeon]
MKRGLFLVIEGPDASGQSTQTELLAKWFERRGLKVFVTKEPTNSLIGGVIRAVLKKEWKIDMRTLQLLFTADRAHHLRMEINPMLERGINVVCDRYILSTLAFGSTEEDLEWLKQINSKFPEPDLTFILNVPGKICAERIAKSRFGFEFFETAEKLEIIRKNYLDLKDFYKNTHVIKGYNRSPVKVHKDIVEIIEKFCLEKGIKI